MTTMRLAFGGNRGAILRSLRAPPQPALLVSFIYHAEFSALREGITFRDWVLDSGAFTAHANGKPIALGDYAAFCTRELRDPTLTEVFSLDVIGDWRATMRNTEQLWSMGIPAIPTYHVGEPIDALMIMARDYPKIALGGAVGLRKAAKLAWAKEVMRRVWPKPVHGFGFGSPSIMIEVPFHSTDASNWIAGPMAFANWQAYGSLPTNKGTPFSVRVDVDRILEGERLLRWRWRSALTEIAEQYSRHEELMREARKP